MGSLYINSSQVVMINKKLRTVVPKITATYILLIKNWKSCSFNFVTNYFVYKNGT